MKMRPPIGMLIAKKYGVTPTGWGSLVNGLAIIDPIITRNGESPIRQPARVVITPPLDLDFLFCSEGAVSHSEQDSSPTANSAPQLRHFINYPLLDS
ncbi:MAG: hypothetical protein EBS85_03395 [Micrococcales bacterium]|nr:hypothetical protein [Micrococcales bacterium]